MQYSFRTLLASRECAWVNSSATAAHSDEVTCGAASAPGACARNRNGEESMLSYVNTYSFLPVLPST
jgi:hypothetical protein